MSSALSATRSPLGHAFRGGVLWWCLVAACCALTARLTMESLQLGCAAAIVVITLGLYFHSRTAGLVAVWLTWLVAPFLRRVFFLEEEIVGSDPLSLVPFLVTGAVAAFDLVQIQLSHRARKLLAFVVGGYAIGVPFGVLRSPTAAAFALFAYLTAAGCFVIGYREGGEQRGLSLPGVLTIATPLLALYAFQQYFVSLPEWDAVWRETAEIGVVGSPDLDRIRVWSTLNSPGTFALVLGVASVAVVALGRFNPLRVAGALAVLGALGLTYVRSAWVGLAAAVIAIAAVSPGAAVRRVAPVAVLLVLLAPVAVGGLTGGALSERAGSFGTLGSDESTQSRINTSLGVLPFALTAPLGYGVGRAGEAVQLSETGGFRYTDNGYLALLFQVGPVGFLLIMAAIFMMVRSAVRNARGRRDPPDILVVGALAFLLITLLAGDQLYGVGGMIFWYMGGLAVRRAEADA